MDWRQWLETNPGCERVSKNSGLACAMAWDLPPDHGTLKESGHAMKNFHLPLPEPIYTQLRAEAERTQVPATALAREAIDSWLKEQARKARRDAIAAYATEVAGTDLDLDRALESAGIDHLVKVSRKHK